MMNGERKTVRQQGGRRRRRRRREGKGGVFFLYFCPPAKRMQSRVCLTIKDKKIKNKEAGIKPRKKQGVASVRQASSPKSASFITFLFFFSTTVIVRRPVLLRSAVREEATGPTRKAACLMSGNIL